MGRLILLAVLVYGVYRTIRRVVAHRERLGGQAPPPLFEPTVRCAECGAYVARRHATARGESYICRTHDAHIDG